MSKRTRWPSETASGLGRRKEAACGVVSAQTEEVEEFALRLEEHRDTEEIVYGADLRAVVTS